jgi:hypothetical protein
VGGGQSSLRHPIHGGGVLPLINQARELHRIPMVIKRLCYSLQSDSVPSFF